NPNLIDLSPYYNTSISTKKGLASVPLGVQHMSGVDFDIRSLVEVGQLAPLRRVKKIPTQVKEILVDLPARRLYFLHAADDVESDGTEVGHYTIHYVDGEERKIPIVFGKDLATYWAQPDDQNKELVVAWTSVSETVANRRRTSRLFKTTWENPR